MTRMQASRSAAKAIEFKGGALAATTAYIRDAHTMRLADAMHSLLGGMPEFFAGELAVLDFSELAVETDKVDWPGLVSLLRRYGLQPFGVRHVRADWVDAARKAGLVIVPDTGATAHPAPAPAAAPATAPAAAPSPAPSAAAPLVPAGPTMTIERPLRSGQQIYARGTDLVVLGGVSPGAEVIADGSIHCYGPLRGRAIAGAQGDSTARIITTTLAAELVSIAGVFRTFERGLPPEVAGKPAHIRLVGEGESAQLRVDPLALA